MPQRRNVAVGNCVILSLIPHGLNENNIQIIEWLIENGLPTEELTNCAMEAFRQHEFKFLLWFLQQCKNYDINNDRYYNVLLSTTKRIFGELCGSYFTDVSLTNNNVEFNQTCFSQLFEYLEKTFKTVRPSELLLFFYNLVNCTHYLHTYKFNGVSYVEEDYKDTLNEVKDFTCKFFKCFGK